MPTAYIKKLAKLNHTTVNKLEKFWSQAKEIAKSEGNGKAWGLITTIFQNKLKKEGYKIKAFTLLADTDEYDDADLGINVNPKEYHKQKSLQMSLQSKLDMIKKDINKETDKYNKELVEWGKELNKRNREDFDSDNRGDKWLKYKGPITEKVLIEAFVDGFKHDVRGLNTKRAVNIFKQHNLPGYLKLLNKEKLVVYRGINFLFTINSRYNKGKNIKDDRIFKYLKYNLMDRNSWSLSKDVAEGYLDDEEYGLILKMTCSLEDVNLPLSAWLEGNWYYNDNQEINIRKSFKIKDIKCVFMGSEVSKYYGITKESFNKVTAVADIDSNITKVYKRIKEKPFRKELAPIGKFGKGMYFYDDERMLTSDNSKTYGDVKVKIDIDASDCLDLNKPVSDLIKTFEERGCSSILLKMIKSFKQPALRFYQICMLGACKEDMKKFGCIKYKSPQCEFGNEIVIYDLNRIKSFEYV